MADLEFTGPVHTALLRARDLALTQETHTPTIGPGHLLLALLEDPESSATRILGEQCDVTSLRCELARRLIGTRDGRWWEAPDVPYTLEARRALTLGARDAEANGERQMRPVHLLHGLFSLDAKSWEGDPTWLAAKEARIDLQELRTRVLAAGTA